MNYIMSIRFWTKIQLIIFLKINDNYHQYNIYIYHYKKPPQN